jgi:hypothetical protein
VLPQGVFLADILETDDFRHRLPASY